MYVSQMSIAIISVSPEQHLYELSSFLGATTGDISFKAVHLSGYFSVFPERRKEKRSLCVCSSAIYLRGPTPPRQRLIFQIKPTDYPHRSSQKGWKGKDALH